MLVAWAVAVAGGLLAGLATHDMVVHTLERQRLERHAVTAVLAEDAAVRMSASARAVDDDRVWVTVRWTASDGSVRTGQTRVPPDRVAGTRVTVWTDEGDRLTSKPVTHGEAVLQGVLVGSVVVVVAGGAVLGTAQGVRGWLDRRRMERWAEEWERIDTRWGRKTG